MAKIKPSHDLIQFKFVIGLFRIKNTFLVSTETEVLRRWESETKLWFDKVSSVVYCSVLPLGPNTNVVLVPTTWRNILLPKSIKLATKITRNDHRS